MFKHVEANAARDYAKSLLWNLDSRRLTECVSKGIDVGMWTTTKDGWARISRHAAGKGSAYVQAHKIRTRHDNIDTKVVGVDDQEWKAEVWIKRKAPTE